MKKIMNKILLFSDGNVEDTAIADLSKLSKFRIVKSNDPDQALKLIKRHSPDFVLCTGKIRQEKNGNFVLDLT